MYGSDPKWLDINPRIRLDFQGGIFSVIANLISYSSVDAM